MAATKSPPPLKFREKQIGYGRTAADPKLGKARGIRLPQEIDDLLQTLPAEERVILIREAVTKAVKERFQ